MLGRLPAPARRTAAAIPRLLAAICPHPRFPGADAAGALFSRLAALGISGGAVNDALVGATAVEHTVPLVTRDRGALGTYRALDADVVLVP